MKLFLFLFVLILTNLAWCQKVELYYSTKWEVTDKKHAAYFTLYTWQDSVYKEEDYYLTKKPYCTGYCLSYEKRLPKYRTGHYIWYDSVGFKTLEGDYKNGKRVGVWKTYLKKSAYSYRESYFNDSELLFHCTYDSVTHKLKSKSVYNDGLFQLRWQFDKSDSFIENQDLWSEYKKTRTSLVLDPKGVTRSKSIYIDGIFVSKDCFNSENLKITCDTPQSKYLTVFTYVEQLPKPSFNIDDYLMNNVVYPKYAQRNKIEGRVVLNFMVDTNGVISKVKIVRGLGGGCDEEAIRLISEMPTWIPGRQNKRKVCVSYTIPVWFKLD